jgi:hypothetical protein
MRRRANRDPGGARTRRAQLVGRTELSYTYAQTPKEGTLYNLNHGTLDCSDNRDQLCRRRQFRWVVILGGYGIVHLIVSAL